ncbi:MAG: hypothetical protein JWL79_1797 [Frankiales bacterium]|nr:hypothetical protein [Frankiales bacterium]
MCSTRSRTPARSRDMRPALPKFDSSSGSIAVCLPESGCSINASQMCSVDSPSARPTSSVSVAPSARMRSRSALPDAMGIPDGEMLRRCPFASTSCPHAYTLARCSRNRRRCSSLTALTTGPPNGRAPEGAAQVIPVLGARAGLSTRAFCGTRIGLPRHGGQHSVSELPRSSEVGYRRRTNRPMTKNCNVGSVMTIRSTQPNATPMSAKGLFARFAARSAMTTTAAPTAATPTIGDTLGRMNDGPARSLVHPKGFEPLTS